MKAKHASVIEQKLPAAQQRPHHVFQRGAFLLFFGRRKRRDHSRFLDWCRVTRQRGQIGVVHNLSGWPVLLDPARCIATHVSVDHIAVVEFEEERVVRIVRVAVRACARDLPRCSLAAVLDDRGSFADGAGR